MQRRYLAAVLGAGMTGVLTPTGINKAWAQTALVKPVAIDFAALMKTIERDSGGRLGTAIFDTATGRSYAYRADERFPMCSTFKLLAAALVLKRVDAGLEQLDKKIRFGTQDLITYSPVTETRTGTPGMTMAELCEAAVTLSDNTAANLLLESFGGPAGLTAFARSLGDQTTRLDRIEPHLNEATPGDARDTTSPRAMAGLMQKLVLGDGLSAASQQQLRAWMLGTKTSDKRLRAPMPAGWQVGDKTGGGAHGTTNDIGILWPPRRAPIVISVYLTHTSRSLAEREATIAKLGELAVRLSGSVSI